MTSHIAKDCRAPGSKIRRYKEEQRKEKRAQELTYDKSESPVGHAGASAGDGFGYICQMCGPELGDFKALEEV